MSSESRTIDTAAVTPFDSLLGGYKTYITAGLGIIINVLNVFDILTLTTEQMTAINGAVILLAAVFLRLGIGKAQLAAVLSAKQSKETEQATQTQIRALMAASSGTGLGSRPGMSPSSNPRTGGEL